MIVIGLTGSIATGKSFVADIFKEKNMAVFDSDFEVAKLLESQEVINLIKNCSKLSLAILDNKVDKKLLSKTVFNDKEALDSLEKILHPLVEREANDFIKSKELDKIIVLEIPLLFEKNYKKYCNKVITTYCSERVQRERALSRKNIDSDRFNFIIKQQMPINLKALLTDYIVYTEVSEDYTRKQIEEILLKEQEAL
ncbi:MAG: dephospho-CoA kinase [Rickettsiales bacterium]|jgi:dephospho-CoA kinase|nr:dephospho-CoA kinase [Rickettsiales bacterium]